MKSKQNIKTNRQTRKAGNQTLMGFDQLRLKAGASQHRFFYLICKNFGDLTLRIKKGQTIHRRLSQELIIVFTEKKRKGKD